MIDRITAETTDHEIMAPVQVARRRLEEFLHEKSESYDVVGEKLFEFSNNIHRAEQLARVQKEYRNLISINPGARMYFLVETLSQPTPQTVQQWARDESRMIYSESKN